MPSLPQASGGQRNFAHAHAQTPHACVCAHTCLVYLEIRISMRASVRRGSTPRRWWRRAHRHVRPAFYHDPTAGLEAAFVRSFYLLAIGRGGLRRVRRGAGTRETSLIASSAARLAQVSVQTYLGSLPRGSRLRTHLPLTTFAVENPVPEDEAPCERAIARGHASKDDDGVPSSLLDAAAQAAARPRHAQTGAPPNIRAGTSCDGGG